MLQLLTRGTLELYSSFIPRFPMIGSFTVVYRVRRRSEMAALVRSVDLSADLPALPQTLLTSGAQIAEGVLVPDFMRSEMQSCSPLAFPCRSSP